MPTFDHVHPEYALWVKRWEMLYDFMRGGLHVLQPGHETGTASFWQLDSSGGSDTGTSSEKTVSGESRYSWVSSPTNSYLFSHERERKNRWNDREKRAVHIPVCKPVLEIYTTGVLRTGPQRDNNQELDPRWVEFHKNVDLTGESLDSFIRKALGLALGLTRVHAIVDKPRTENAPKSLKEQMDSGSRAYCYLVTPFDLVDWALDEFGEFEWVRIREDMLDTRSPTEKPKQKKSAYRIWTKTGWELYYPPEDEKSTDGYYLVDSGEHNLGEVPIATLYAKRANRQTIESESLLTDLVDIDRSIYNKMSLLDEIDYGQTFSQLAIPDSSKLGITGANVGPLEGFTFDPEGGPPIYLSPNPAMASGLWERIVELFHTARVVAGVSRGRAEFSKEERSAAAISHEAEEKHNQMAYHAAMVEEFEQDIHRLVAKWENIESDKIPNIAYNKKFDIKDLTDKLRDALDIKKLNPGDIAMGEVNKTVVGEFLKQSGVDEKAITIVKNDIEAYTKELGEALRTFGVQGKGQDE